MELQGFTDVSPLLRSGIYALCKRGTVLYIGKSKSLYARIYAHRNLANRAQKGQRPPAWFPASLRGIVFDEVHIRPCHVDDIDRLEAEMINLYKPKFNMSLKHNLAVRIPLDFTIGGVYISAQPRPQITRRL